MFKVVIADDHFQVLEYLQACIPWQSMNLELSAICSNGGEALEACQSYQPDILITDIGMPVMDGLELIKKVREERPQLKAIILSCHEEFHYAQQAVKLNVKDYILKENMHVEHIRALLQQLSDELSMEQSNEFKQKDLQTVVEKNLFAIRSTFIRKFLEQPVWNESDWVDDAERIGIQMKERIPYLPVVIVPERSLELEARFGGSLNLQFVIDNALRELINVEGSVLLVPNQRQYVFLFPLPTTLKVNLHEEIRSKLRLVQQAMLRHLRIVISCYYGDVCKDLLELRKQLQQLLEAKTFRFYAGERILAKVLPVSTSQEDIFQHYAMATQELRECILNGDEEYISKTVAAWGNHIRSMLYPIESVKSWLLKITMELELKYTVMQNFITNFNSELQQKNISSIETLDHLLEFLEKFLIDKSSTINKLREQNVRKEIAEAQRFIQLHICEKISMEEMAQRLNLNPSHFSRIFKQETGQTFVEFLTATKMERAKELLNQSDATVNEIAEQLGYEYTSYFIKLFRSYAGMSPNEYRKSS